MSLKLHKRSGSPNWYIRGTAAGREFYENTGTPDKKTAERIKAEIEKAAWDGSPP